MEPFCMAAMWVRGERKSPACKSDELQTGLS